MYCVDLSLPNYPVTCISDITVGGYVTAADYSDLIYDSYHIYYVGTNNKVVNYYLSGASWYCSTLNGSSQNVISGGAISVDEFGRIFYIGSNGIIYQFAWTGSIWSSTALPSGQLAGTYSDLLVRNNHIFYVGSNNKIYNYYYTGSTWANAILNTSAPLAQTGTNFSQDEYDRLYYVATDNKVYHFTYTSGWYAAAISNTTVKPWATPKFQKYCGKIYYIDNTANTVSFFYYTSASGWTSNNVYANNSSTPTNYYASYFSDILITDNGDVIYNSVVDNKLHLLSPQINWKTVTVASGLTSMINGSAGAETSLTITKRPFDFQFYPRNNSNIGTISCEGNVCGFGDITWKIEKTPFSGAVTYTVTSPTGINQSTGDFTSSLSITAELSEYKISYKLGCQTKYTVLADKVVCGDAFIASGQSNMHAADGELNMCTLNSNFGATSTYGKYSRSFGDNITESRTWGIPSANNDITAYYDTHPIGALILPLQYKLQQTYGIPTCFINNALGGTSIDAHQLNTIDKFYFEYGNCITVTPPTCSGQSPYVNCWNFQNIEGHLMRRIYAAGLQNSVKGFVWYQGESEVSNGYASGLYKQKFKQLYDGLTTGIPSLSSSSAYKNTKTYLIQIHSSPYYMWDGPNCLSITSYPYANMVGEDMRTIASYIPYANISVASSNGAKYPNCSGIHFNEAGYEEIATRVFNEMKSGSFGATYNVVDFPLDIVSATKNTSTNKVTLTFNQAISPSLSDNLDNVLNAIYPSNGSTPVSGTGVISGNTLTFNVTSTSGLTAISYLGSLPSNCNGNLSPACTTLVAQTACTPGLASSISNSWWCPSYLKNSAGNAALSFYNIPVSTEGLPQGRLMNAFATSTIESSSNKISIFPNPAQNIINVSSEMKIKKFKIVDLRGKTLMELSPDSSSLQINTSEWEQGIYIIQCSDEISTITQKLIINK